MILRIEDLKEVCSKILFAVDSSDLSVLTESLELKTENKLLYLSTTNREYYVRVKLPIDSVSEFHATVNANVFLKLISQTTSETVELTIDNNTLIVKGNGVYKLPLIYDNDKLLSLPEISINNSTCEFDIDVDVLNSILNYNSKELARANITHPVQKLYYVDENGCITFTTGACVNTFNLEKPVKFLLSQKVVKLFKLFKSGKVKFTLGHDSISSEIVQTKVNFVNDNVELTAILPGDDALISSVPVTAIRNRASATYPYSVNINRDSLLQAINRMSIFLSSKSFALPTLTLKFCDEYVTLKCNETNEENIYYETKLSGCDYTNTVDLYDIKSILDACNESYIVVNFGDNQSMVISRGNISNVIPEIVTADTN